MVLKSIIEKDLLVFRFNLSVKDNGASNQLESIQTIQLHFIADDPMNFFFKRIFYYFKVVESIEINKIFGYINSFKLMLK